MNPTTPVQHHHGAGTKVWLTPAWGKLRDSCLASPFPSPRSRTPHTLHIPNTPLSRGNTRVYCVTTPPYSLQTEPQHLSESDYATTHLSIKAWIVLLPLTLLRPAYPSPLTRSTPHPGCFSAHIYRQKGNTGAHVPKIARSVCGESPKHDNRKLD